VLNDVRKSRQGYTAVSSLKKSSKDLKNCFKIQIMKYFMTSEIGTKIRLELLILVN